MMNLNPGQMKKIAQQFGLKELKDVEEVIIRTSEKEIVIKNPQVSTMNMMGQKTWQIVGNEEEAERKAEISEEDIKVIMEKTGKSEKEAKKALEECDFDIAEAILKLSE